jgi:hypothetical protein
MLLRETSDSHDAFYDYLFCEDSPLSINKAVVNRIVYEQLDSQATDYERVDDFKFKMSQGYKQTRMNIN